MEWNSAANPQEIFPGFKFLFPENSRRIWIFMVGERNRICGQNIYGWFSAMNVFSDIVAVQGFSWFQEKIFLTIQNFAFKSSKSTIKLPGKMIFSTIMSAFSRSVVWRHSTPNSPSPKTHWNTFVRSHNSRSYIWTVQALWMLTYTSYVRIWLLWKFFHFVWQPSRMTPSSSCRNLHRWARFSFCSCEGPAHRLPRHYPTVE